MRTRYLFGISSLLAALCSGCGGGGGGGGGGGASSGQPPNSPNSGVGWLRTSSPTSSGAFETDSSTVALEGSSFVPVGFFCSPSLIPYFAPIPTGYEVRFSNNSTSTSLFVRSTLACVFGIPVVTWRALAPLSMGANSIAFTVTDGAGNTGRNTIAVTRITDTTPPAVVPASPVSGASGVGVNASVTVTFSEEMDQSTINTTTVTLMDGANNPVTATVTYNRFSLAATLTPTNWLAKNTSYHATVTTEARDASGGNALAAPYKFSFTTGANLE